MARRGGRRRRQPRVAATRPEGPQRTCIGCRVQHPRGALVRLVCSDAGEVLVDRYLRAPGRGAHLCYDLGCLTTALRKNAFSRAFHRPANEILSPEAPALVSAMLASIDARVRDGLSLGRRARQVVSGTGSLAGELRRGRVRLLLLAEDVALGTRSKLARRARAAGCCAVVYGAMAALGRTQGTSRRAALAITDESLAARLRLELKRREQLQQGLESL